VVYVCVAYVCAVIMGTVYFQQNMREFKAVQVHRHHNGPGSHTSLTDLSRTNTFHPPSSTYVCNYVRNPRASRCHVRWQNRLGSFLLSCVFLTFTSVSALPVSSAPRKDQPTARIRHAHIVIPPSPPYHHDSIHMPTTHTSPPLTQAPHPNTRSCSGWSATCTCTSTPTASTAARPTS
jgi:hypothetical protein